MAHGGETWRPDELYALNIFDTAPEERFDCLTRLARQIFDVLIALLTAMVVLGGG